MIDPDLVALYTESLQDLKENNRIHIHNLTDHARDHEGDAESIVTAIETYIQKCDPAKRLFVLYVVDSIVKNVKGSYVDEFSPYLVTIFLAVWDAVPTQRERLMKVLRLWSGHFPEDVLQQVRDRVGLETPGATTPLMSPESPGSYQPTRPAAASQQRYYPPAAAPVPQMATYPQYLSATVTVAAPAPPPPLAVPPAGFHGQGFARPMVMPAAGYLQQPLLRPAMPLYAAQQPQPFAMAAAGGYGSTAGVPQRSMQPVVSTLQQQAYAAPRAASAPAAAVQEPAPAAQESENSDELARRAIQNIKSIIENTSEPSTTGRTMSSEALHTLDFAALSLKEFHPAVIEELQTLSDHHRPELLNIQFTRRRRQKLNPARQRQWFATADQWVAVTGGLSDAPPTFFEDDERAAEEVPECSEPLDESQTECAISGDAFEVYWDAATETHRYRHAKRLYGDEAASYGVPDGSLVNVKSLMSFGHPLMSSTSAGPEPEQAADEQGAPSQPAAAAQPLGAGSPVVKQAPGASGHDSRPHTPPEAPLAGPSAGDTGQAAATSGAVEGSGSKRPHDGGAVGIELAALSAASVSALEDALAAARKKVKMDPDAVEPPAINC